MHLVYAAYLLVCVNSAIFSYITSSFNNQFFLIRAPVALLDLANTRKHFRTKKLAHGFNKKTLYALLN